MTNDIHVGFAGDWHGNLRWAQQMLDAFAARGITHVFHVGDFGIWPNDKQYLQGVNAKAEKLDITIYVTLGNHEDYNRVALLRQDEEGWLRFARYAHIRVAPRAHTWELDGITFASLGGAGSIDRLVRVEGESWWPQEEITSADRDALIKKVRAHNWPAVDVFLSHEAPAGLQRIGMARTRWMTEEVLDYCYQQRVLLREAVDEIQPLTMFNGHWHDFYDEELSGVSPHGVNYRSRSIGLSTDGSPLNSVTAIVRHSEGLVDLRRMA